MHKAHRVSIACANFSSIVSLCLLQSDGDNKDDILKVFRLFDDDDSGAITLNDLLRVARELGETMTQGMSSSEQHAQHMVWVVCCQFLTFPVLSMRCAIV